MAPDFLRVREIPSSRFFDRFAIVRRRLRAQVLAARMASRSEILLSYVATVGPGSYPESLVEKTEGTGPFLWPTDFGAASLRALPHAISFANQYGAKLVALNVLPPVPIPEGFHWSTTGDLKQMRERAQMASQNAFEQLMEKNAPMRKKPGFMVKFGIPGDQIPLAARALHADLIILGLKRPAHIGAASHFSWEIAYRVVCGAYCPVLTIRS